MDILLGLVLIVLGLVVTFAGLRVFLIALPIIGFILGFFAGTVALQEWFGQGFLATVTSWIVGIIVGLVFAVISYLWWYIGALLSAGTLGASIGTGIIHAFGGTSAWLLFIFGAIGFVLFFVGALLLNLPVYVVIVSTAYSGAIVSLAGLLLLIGQVERAELWRGAAVATINASWFWVLIWAVLGTIGLFVQLSMREETTLPEERWVTAGSA